MAPLAAIVLFWAAGPVTMPLLAVALVEAAAIAVLAVQIVLYADVKRS
jgi:hypothetical protein